MNQQISYIWIASKKRFGRYNKQHLSGFQTQNHILHDMMYSLDKATATQIETEIIELNSKKTSSANGIPTNILKESIRVKQHPLIQLYNVYLLINYIFFTT